MFRKLFHSFKQAFISIFRNRGMAVTSIFSITAMLIILGLFFVLTINVNVATESIKGQFDTIEVYLLDDTTSQQAETLTTQIKSMSEVTDVQYVTKDQAMEEFKQRFGNNAYLLDSLADNPLPNSLRITLTDIQDGDYVAEVCSNMRGVEDVRYYQSEIEKIIKIAEGIKKGAFIVIIALIVVSIVVVSNTVKLTVMARSEEIRIQKHIGATNWFIRGPLITEGMIIGFISAVFALAISAFVYIKFIELFGQQLAILASMQLVDAYYMIISLAWIFVALGVAIGAVGSLISMRRFLKV